MIQRGKPPGDALLDRVCDLVVAERINVVTTDLTIQEIAKRHAQNDLKKIESIANPQNREVLENVLGTTIENVSEAEMLERLLEQYTTSVTEMFNALEAKVLSVDTVTPTSVFDDYAHGRGMFAKSNKKDQFPDAFILKTLEKCATKINPITIISGDKDFGDSVKSRNIEIEKELISVFNFHKLDVTPPNTSDFSKKRKILTTLLEKTVNDFGFIVTDTLEAEILNVTVKSYELIPLTTFKSIGKCKNLLLVGEVEMVLSLQYQHPEWETATYDSEDGVLIPLHQVEGTIDYETNAKISFLYTTDKNGKVKEISKLNLIDIGFLEVELERNLYE